MAISISMKTMAARTKKRFLMPMLFSILTFVAALAAIWIVHEQPVDFSSVPRRESDPLAMTVFEAALSGLCFSVAGALLAEALKREQLRAALAAAGFAVGAGLYCLCGAFSANVDICLCLVSSAVLLCCALIARGERPAESLGRALGCFFLCAAVSALVMLVLYLLISAVTALFAAGLHWQVENQLSTTAFALSALLVAPFLLFSFLPGEDTPREKYSGFRKVLSYVILPAYLLLLAVLLGYIVTIAAKWELPVGRMNPYAVLALGTFAALHLLLTGEENALSRFFVRYGAWLLLPVIAVQTIAVYIRIDAYGLTPARILGLAFTAACLIPVVSALLRRSGRTFFIVGAVLLFVLMATPLNARMMARVNQESRLFSALANAGMLDEMGRILQNDKASGKDQEIIWASAQYLDANREDLPKNGRAARLIEQLDATREEGKEVYYGHRAKALFGFDDPNRQWYSKTQSAEGVSTTTQVEVEGFRQARLMSWWIDEESGWCADADGDIIAIDTLLALADFESGTLAESDIALPSGRTLRINYLNRTEWNPAESDGTVSYRLSAWLLTP